MPSDANFTRIRLGGAVQARRVRLQLVLSICHTNQSVSINSLAYHYVRLIIQGIFIHG